MNTNEEIALKLGWLRLGTSELQAYQKSSPWTVDDGRIWLSLDGSLHTNPPDFEHDWAHAGPLLEELIGRFANAVSYFKNPIRVFGKCYDDEPAFLVHIAGLKGETKYEGSGDTLTQAISRAWLAWKKEDRDG